MQKTMIFFPARNVTNERLYISSLSFLNESRLKWWSYKCCCSEFIWFQMQWEIHSSFQKITHQFSSKGFHVRISIDQFSVISHFSFKYRNYDCMKQAGATSKAPNVHSMGQINRSVAKPWDKEIVNINSPFTSCLKSTQFITAIKLAQ